MVSDGRRKMRMCGQNLLVNAQWGIQQQFRAPDGRHLGKFNHHVRKLNKIKRSQNKLRSSTYWRHDSMAISFLGSAFSRFSSVGKLLQPGFSGRYCDWEYCRHT
ncbi:MAG TPA: hypothetical protein VE242_04545 [Chthoniobacterales bacterium]|nr:hypothetical protein [Chthoniobacterales bacterium]